MHRRPKVSSFSDIFLAKAFSSRLQFRSSHIALYLQTESHYYYCDKERKNE
jgi:hypothetical protein